VSHFAVSAIGQDQPGIVAAITAELLAVEGNIEDSRMSILRGHFAVMLIVAVPDPVSSEELESRLQSVGERLGLEAVSVKEVAELEDAAAPASHVLTVYGADHPGIVHAVASALAERGVNITDLETMLADRDREPIYVLVLEISLGDADADEVEQALREVGKRAEVDVSLRRLESAAL
jgi:glycine cleavage system transcriptional repressor